MLPMYIHMFSQSPFQIRPTSPNPSQISSLISARGGVPGLLQDEGEWLPHLQVRRASKGSDSFLNRLSTNPSYSFFPFCHCTCLEQLLKFTILRTAKIFTTHLSAFQLPSAVAVISSFILPKLVEFFL